MCEMCRRDPCGVMGIKPTLFMNIRNHVGSKPPEGEVHKILDFNGTFCTEI